MIDPIADHEGRHTPAQRARKNSGDRPTGDDRDGTPAGRQAPGHRESRAGLALGFAAGGFFDGILLHQILQWHHLLGGVRGLVDDIRIQLLADGAFHLLMYVIALVGGIALWRASRAGRAPAGGRLGAQLAIGFGAWHLADAVLSHWLLGLHRIRMDVADPLFWDLLWLGIFGLLPLVIGGFLYYCADDGGRGRGPPGRHGAATGVLLLAVAAAGMAAALPPRDGEQVAVLVRPARMVQLLDGVAEQGGGILWGDRSGTLWVFHLPDGGDARHLRRHGALHVTRSAAVMGCLAWSRGLGAGAPSDPAASGARAAGDDGHRLPAYATAGR